MRRPTPVLALLALACAIAAGAPAATSVDPGITPATILLGGTAPLTGTASADASVARGAGAYFKYVNSRGGVNGRTIAYKVVDDGDDRVRAAEATRQLVEQDRVFAIFNSVGTEPNVATRDYLNAQKVPQLFVASGATTFGRDFEHYPWTIGFQPSRRAEGWIYGKYLARTKRGAKVGVLFQDDDDGKDLTAGLKEGIARSQVKVVAAQPFEVGAPDVQSQISKLRSSGANVLALFASPRHANEGAVFANRIGWRPLIITSGGGSSKAVENSISIVFLKDPTDVKWRNDPALKLYRSIMSRFAKGADQRDSYHVYGMAAAYELVHVLKGAGRNPTRASVLAQTRKLNDPSNPFLLPGMSVETSATERFPIEQAQLQRWSRGSWRSFGGLWSYRAG
jgi:branched-chain amino acid transport system substrate-binding protein